MFMLPKVIAIVLTLLALAGYHPAQAAPRQLVIVVADGLSPKVIDFGTGYLKKAFEIEETIAFEDVKSQGRAQAVAADALSSLRGVLKAAADNGYKTGLVTSGNVAQVAPLYFDLQSDGADAARALVVDTKVDFLAGGGRTLFVSNKIPGSKRSDDFDASRTVRDAGGTVYFNAESLEEEAKGRVLALQSDDELSYAIDRDEESQAGFDELVSLALDTLGGETNTPFVLVVHDTLLARSLTAGDTPAAVEQLHLIDNILGDLLTRREGNTSDFAVALLGVGGTIAPRFTADKADELANAIFILSNLPLSYSGAGAKLKGADEAALTNFATEHYKGWKVSPEERSGILSGTIAPETAIRASYERAVKVSYETVPAEGILYAVGLSGDDLLQAVKQAVSSKPGQATLTAQAPAQ
jgi:hypothetical protein